MKRILSIGLIVAILSLPMGFAAPALAHSPEQNPGAEAYQDSEWEEMEEYCNSMMGGDWDMDDMMGDDRDGMMGGWYDYPSGTQGTSGWNLDRMFSDWGNSLSRGWNSMMRGWGGGMMGGGMMGW